MDAKFKVLIVVTTGLGPYDGRAEYKTPVAYCPKCGSEGSFHGFGIYLCHKCNEEF